MTRLATCLLLGLTLAAANARADEVPAPSSSVDQLDSGGGGDGRGSGSLLSGKPLGAGVDALHFQFGWPGISATYLHGSSHALDVGGSFAFDYSIEGTLHTSPGLKLAGVLRLGLVDTGKFDVGLRLDPGLTMYFDALNSFDGSFALALATPVALVFGVRVGDAISLNLNLALPMAVFLAPQVVFELPILTGVGLEYRVDSHLSVTFNTAFGPDVFIGRANGNSTSHTDFAFMTLAGIGYRL